MSTSVQTLSRSSHSSPSVTEEVPAGFRRSFPRGVIASSAIRGNYSPSSSSPSEAVVMMKPLARTGEHNPLSDLIPDELYYLLRTNDLINEKGLRDFIIRRVYQQLREVRQLNRGDAIEELQAIYPYLQVDTIRKIIYRVYPSGPRKSMI
jgi:hypothetical protein